MIWAGIGPGRPAPPTGGRVGQEHSDLAVLLLADRPGVLALDPGRAVALFDKPVSSSTNTACGSPRCSTTSSRKSSRTPSASHPEPLSSRCIPSGVCSPACSASHQLFLRSTWLSSPCR
jgi:hypothetical protein